MKSHNINYNKIITEEEEEEFYPELDIKINDFDFFNQEILDEINDAREFPDKYAEKLELILNNLKTKDEKFLFLESVPFIYNDLYNSLNDAIKFLKSQKKLPSLMFLDSMADACDKLVDEYVTNINYKNNNLTFEKRINNYGQSSGENYEIITWDMPDPEFLVINLILSDEDKSKFTRKVIFNPNLKYIGLSSGVFPTNKICSIINFCEDFYDEQNPNVEQNKKKEKKNTYISKIISSKISKINPKEKGKIKLAKNSKIENNDKNIPLRNKNNSKNINNNNKNINLRNPPKKNITRSIFDYDLENFDEEEFFEKEFDTNYGKYEKEKNSHKKLLRTTSTNENGQQTTIITTIVENVDKNGIKRGYFLEKEENVNFEAKNYINNKENEKEREERIEKEKRDMKILKEMERKEKEKIEKEKYNYYNKKRIKEIPIKLRGKKEFDENEYFDDEQFDIDPNADLPEGAVRMHVQQKTITDSNGEPTLEVTKTITYPDGHIQQFVNP